MTITDVAFGRVRQSGRVLKEVFGRGKDHPGTLATMSSLDEWLDVLITRSNEVAKRERLLICGAGASRVTDISADPNLAVKLTDIGRYEPGDNKNEFDARFPEWLAPRVYGYLPLKLVTKHTQLRVSVLIVDKMPFTLQELRKKVPHVRKMKEAQQGYVEGIAAEWSLLARGLKEKNYTFTDWATKNLMVTQHGYKRGAADVRLAGWAGATTTDDTPYKRAKMARKALIRDIGCLQYASTSGSAVCELWFDALEVFRITCLERWPPGPLQGEFGWCANCSGCGKWKNCEKSCCRPSSNSIALQAPC